MTLVWIFSRKRFININAKAGDKCWVPPDQARKIAGYEIPGGMIYVGKSLPPVGGWQDVEPALINPSLPVARRKPDVAGESMGYWPSYSEISPQAHAAYLSWLAGGRSDPGAYIGYVFLFFYGLERRRDALIEKCAAEWSKVLKVPIPEYWTKAIPQALLDTLNSWGNQYSTPAAEAYLTEQGYRVIPPASREAHQIIVDGLAAWVANGSMTKERAQELEQNIVHALPGGSDDQAKAILWQIGKDGGLDAPNTNAEGET